ncbi:reverse transcriptase domain-containing protein [Tanacetum coccineum]
MSFVIERDIPELINDSTATGDRLIVLEQDQVKNLEEIHRLKNQVQSANISTTLAAMDRDRIEKTQDQDGKQIRELRHRLTSAEIRLEVASFDRYRLESAAVEAAEVARAAESTRVAATASGAGGSNNAGPAAGARGHNVARPTVGVVAMNVVPEVRESVFLISKYAKKDKVKYATSTLLDEALSWWNSVAQPIGIENAYKIPWVELKKMMIKEYCPRSEVQKLEVELWNHMVKGVDITTYNRRFQELAILCLAMVPTIEKLLESYVWGLPQPIQGNVTSFDLATIDEAMRMAHRLMDQAVRAGTVLVHDNNHNCNHNINNPNNNNNNNNNNKRRWNDNRRGDNNNPNNQNQNISHHNQQNHRQENARGYAIAVAAPAG